jgi:hypothetical protein
LGIDGGYEGTQGDQVRDGGKQCRLEGVSNFNNCGNRWEDSGGYAGVGGALGKSCSEPVHADYSEQSACSLNGVERVVDSYRGGDDVSKVIVGGGGNEEKFSVGANVVHVLKKWENCLGS